jgi:MerR family transcriptional regulator, light-induced transcriptional regulator
MTLTLGRVRGSMMPMDEDTTARHPIGVVAKRTGISLHVLRAWERRYDVVRPMRTAGGQRLYSDADIARLRLLRRVTEAGRNISQVAELSLAALAALAEEDGRDAAGRPELDREPPEAGVYVRAALTAGEDLDGEAVHAVLMRGVVSLRPMEFLDGVVRPLLHEVGDRWHAGRLGPAQEHVVSTAVRRVLTWLLDAYETVADAPVLVVTTTAGEQHEFGAMLVSILGVDEGWRVNYLGPSLPASEIVHAAERLRADMVAVSAVAGRSDSDPVAEVAALVEGLPRRVPVLVGGAYAGERADAFGVAGGRVVTQLDDVRQALRQQRELVAGAR